MKATMFSFLAPKIAVIAVIPVALFMVLTHRIDLPEDPMNSFRMHNE